MRTTSEQPITIVCPYEGCDAELSATVSTTIDGPDHKGRVEMYVNVERVGDDAMDHWNETHLDERDADGHYLPTAWFYAWPGTRP